MDNHSSAVGEQALQQIGYTFQYSCLVPKAEGEQKLQGDNEGKPRVTIQQIPSLGLSFQLWPAAEALCTFLDAIENSCRNVAAKTEIAGHSHPRDVPMAGLPPSVSLTSEFAHWMKSSSTNFFSGRKRVLELGAGTGLAGIVASILGAHVTLTDLPSVLGNLRENVELNKDAIAAAGGEVQVEALRWGEREDVEVLQGRFDIVLGADIVYYTQLFEPLLQTLKQLCFCGKEDSLRSSTMLGSRRPIVILAHLRRWKKDNKFFKAASKYFQVVKLCTFPAPLDHRTGVIIYTLQPK